MKRYVTRALVAVAVLGAAAFLAFLYNMPPVLLIAPETFTEDMRTAPPPVDAIADPARRAIAERGRTLVMNTGCIGCHATNGPRGPDLSRYLAGGAVKIASESGTFVSRNLTPDPETGLARRSDDEVLRVLRSGVFPDGRVVSHTTMPWASFSHWTEEDRFAVLAYLRSLPPVRHRIPEPALEPAELPEGAIERINGLMDYAIQ